MKSNFDYKETDKRMSEKIMNEFNGKSWTEQCQTCYGYGTVMKNDISITCTNCNGIGYITYTR